MSKEIIAIDFVPGTHGHFLEIMLNKFFKIAEIDDPFSPTGTSHKQSEEYLQNREFVADHWSERRRDELFDITKVVSIRFRVEDLLLVSSLSLLRAGDFGLDNNNLEKDTVNKLSNQYYQDTLDLLFESYPILDRETTVDIPRNILREFFKFGFFHTNVNGYWLRLQDMRYRQEWVFDFDLLDFYNLDQFKKNLNDIAGALERPGEWTSDLEDLHAKFLAQVPYLTDTAQCDQIVDSVIKELDVAIPKLSLLQESYINAQLEKYYTKEMPFHQVDYFNSVTDMLYYIKNEAPNLYNL